jgi:invasion protein IalB
MMIFERMMDPSRGFGPARRLVGAVLLGLLAFLPGPVPAQETPPAGAAPALAPGQTEERFGNWTLRCMAADGTNPRRCEMVQVLGDNQTGREVLLVAIGYPDGQASPVAWIILPLGVLLPPGIGLKIDQGESHGLPYRACDTGGCATPWRLTDADVAALKAGNELMVIFKDIEGKSLGLPVSLSGFTAAFDKLR